MTEPTTWLFLFIAGALAGLINTLAGNGSAITLSMLTDFMGIPPLVANGTNRVGILAHGLTTTATYEKVHGIDRVLLKQDLIYIWVGGVLGGLIATQVSSEQFLWVYKVMLVLLLIMLFFKPKRWLQPERFTAQLPRLLQIIILFILGLYGGFIQMGMGVILLSFLVLGKHYNITKSNGFKLAAVLSYSLVIVWFFVRADMIHWPYALTLAIGQTLGGFLTVKYITKSKWAENFAYYLLITIIILALLKNFWWS